MQKIRVICVGKLKERFYTDAVKEYTKRLGRLCDLELLELPEERLGDAPSPAQIDAALEKEADAVRDRIPRGAYVVALCIEGRPFSSEDLSSLLANCAAGGRSQIVFLIGSSFGLHSALKAASDLRLSMSSMTFPHHLARVMLLEQLYRAYQIQNGSKYHK